jgi:hypothetical protein
MPGVLQPLVDRMRIVNADGTPTQLFIRWAQQRQIDIGASITAAEALEIATQYVAEFMAAHPLNEGTGIQITPSGDIADGITITAEVQEILDEISSTQGTILFRGAADWQALAPGTAGYFLQTNGAGADPAWAAGGGGGGGSIVKLDRSIVTVATPTIAFASISGAYEDLIIAINGQLSGAADFVWASLNGDTNAANYHWSRGDFQASGIFSQNGTGPGLDIGLLGPNGAGASFADALESTIYGYSGTTFYKNSLSRSTLRIGAGSSQTTNEIQASNWLSTAAVNAITLTANSGNFTVGTTATIYGRE